MGVGPRPKGSLRQYRIRWLNRITLPGGPAPCRPLAASVATPAPPPPTGHPSSLPIPLPRPVLPTADDLLALGGGLRYSGASSRSPPHRTPTMPRSLPVLALLALAAPAGAHPADLLPKDVKYDSAVPTPEKVLGFRVGERHLHHHQLVRYLRRLASSSRRVRLSEYARSHGDRPLLLLTITSPDNHTNLEAIRKLHLQLADP